MKKINITIIIITIILSVFLVFKDLDTNIAWVLKDLSIILTITAPYIFEKIFKKNITEGLKLVWIIFIFLAHFLGVINHFYDKYYYFDKIAHTMSGILSGYVAILILNNKIKNSNINFLFVLSFSALCAVSWEIFEFTCNILVGGDAQRVALTGVDDTMLDMIVALVGSSLFYIFYSFKRAH